MKYIMLLTLLLFGCGGEDITADDEKEIQKLEEQKMSLVIFDRSIVETDTGATIPNATVEVDGGIPQLYSDAAGLNPISNPTSANTNGRVTFYIESGTYTIEATGPSGTQTYEDVVLNDFVGDWVINQVATAQDFTLASNDDGTNFVLTGSGTYNITIDSNSSTPFTGAPRVKFTINNPADDTVVNILNGVQVEFDRGGYTLFNNLDSLTMQWIDFRSSVDFWEGTANFVAFNDTANRVDYDDANNRYFFGDDSGNDQLRIPVSGSTPAQVREPKTDSLRDITTEYERLYEQTAISSQPWNLNTTFRRRHNVTLDNLEIGLNASATPSIFSPQQVHTQNYPVTIIQNGATGLVDLYGDAIALPFVIPQGQLWEFEGTTGGNYKAYRVDSFPSLSNLSFLSPVTTTYVNNSGLLPLQVSNLNFGGSTILSIGATGSGATVEDSRFNDLPDNTHSIEVGVEIAVSWSALDVDFSEGDDLLPFFNLRDNSLASEVTNRMYRLKRTGNEVYTYRSTGRLHLLKTGGVYTLKREWGANDANITIDAFVIDITIDKVFVGIPFGT